MYYVFNKTCIGYSHLKNKTPCQDFSATYKDNERIIITCCDGHGGPQYIRSKQGSKAASDAVVSVFKSLKSSLLNKAETSNAIEKIKLMILCEYNKLIERAIADKPIKKMELTKLTEDEADYIRFNQAKAYGTTLSGAMVFKNKLVVVSIGDTETLGIKKGELIKIFDNSEDPAGNITYSMCQEDACKYLRVAIKQVNEFDGIILCTDGLSSPYQSYENFNSSFLKPTVRRIIRSKSLVNVAEHIEQIAAKLGGGDDVSLSLILNKKTNVKFYR